MVALACYLTTLGSKRACKVVALLRQHLQRLLHYSVPPVASAPPRATFSFLPSLPALLLQLSGSPFLSALFPKSGRLFQIAICRRAWPPSSQGPSR